MKDDLLPEPGVDELIIRLREEVKRGWRNIPQVLHKDHIMSHAADTLTHLQVALAAERAEVARLRQERDKYRLLNSEASTSLAELEAERDEARAESAGLRSAAQAVMAWLDTNPSYTVTMRDGATRAVPVWIFDEKRYGEVCITTDDLRETLAATPAPAPGGE
jgi:hypothetical protein